MSYDTIQKDTIWIQYYLLIMLCGSVRLFCYSLLCSVAHFATLYYTVLPVSLIISMVKRLISSPLVMCLVFLTLPLQKKKKKWSPLVSNVIVSLLTTSFKLPLPFYSSHRRGLTRKCVPGMWTITSHESQSWHKYARVRQKRPQHKKTCCDCPWFNPCGCPVSFQFSRAQELNNTLTCR